MDASNNWTPPTDCIFMGTVEQFRDEAFRRLTKLGGNCRQINNPPGITIYRYLSEITSDNPWTNLALCHIVAEGLPPGNRCQLDFQLNRNAKAGITDWTPARGQIESLLEDLRRVGWIEARVSDHGEPAHQVHVIAEDESPRLTRREEEIAMCLARGMNDEQMAEELVIGKGTVVSHRKNIAGKWSINLHIPLMQEVARQKGYLEDRRG